MRWALLAVFVATYASIATRRLYLLPIGRPSAALAGACAMVVLGHFDAHVGLAPEDALRAVEPNTMVLLFGMMLLAAALGHAGFFDLVIARLAARSPSPVALLYATTIGCGLLSAVLVNDAVCLLATPLVLGVVDRLGAPRVPFLFAVAMGSNAGSALTLGGNPQNMLVAKLGGLAYRAYAFRVAPGALAALVATAAMLHLIHRHELAAAPRAFAGEASEPVVDRTLLRACLVVLAGVIVADLAGAHLAATAVTGAAVALVFARRKAPELLERVDWSVLVFFGSLFVVVAAFQKTGLPQEALAALTRHTSVQGPSRTLVLTLVLSIGSQIVSNVPLILLLEPWIRTLGDAGFVWTVTALVTTLAGNLTLLGSVANVIVVEQARARGSLDFVAYAKVGVPVTIVSTVLAVGFVALTK
jgi:Na+/H+ antiporter NhaD/arsenite permease-like protein